jgi:hypothetical protein
MFELRIYIIRILVNKMRFHIDIIFNGEITIELVIQVMWIGQIIIPFQVVYGVYEYLLSIIVENLDQIIRKKTGWILPLILMVCGDELEIQ